MDTAMYLNADPVTNPVFAGFCQYCFKFLDGKFKRCDIKMHNNCYLNYIFKMFVFILKLLLLLMRFEGRRCLQSLKREWQFKSARTRFT